MEVLIISDLKENIKKYFKSTPRKEILLIVAVASIFMPHIITFAVMITLCAIVLIKREYRNALANVKGMPILAVFSGLLLIVPALYMRWISVLAGVMMLLVLIFMLYAQSMLTSRLFEHSLDICCIMSILPFVFGIIQKLAKGWNYRSTGGLLNANYYGMIIEFIIIISVYRMFVNPKQSKWYLCIITLNIIGLFLCDCQSAWLAIIAGILVLLYSNGYKKYAVIFMIVSALLVFIGIFIPGILPRWDKMPQTFATRMSIWINAIKGILAHPVLGQGTMTYLFNHELYGGYKTYHSHSLYLEPLLSYGLVGASLIISYIVTIFKQMKRNVFISMKKPSAVKTLILAIGVAVCIHGVTDVPIIWIQTGALLAFVISGAFINDKLEAV